MNRQAPTQRFYYHATFVKYLEDILVGGLRSVEHKNYPGSLPVVCLSSLPRDAFLYAYDALEMGEIPDEVYDSGIALLKVNMNQLEHKMKLDPNIDEEDPDSYIYKGRISPERIQLLQVWKSSDLDSPPNEV